MSSDGFSILYTEDHYSKVCQNHDETVAEAILDKLERKQDELEWIDSAERLSNRFQTFFGKDGVQFAEAGFEAHHSEYRAILILAGKVDSLVFHTAVRKTDRYDTSKQKQIIENLSSNANEAGKLALDKVLEIRSDSDRNLIGLQESSQVPQ